MSSIDVFFKTAVCKAVAHTFPLLEYNLPSIDTIVLPSLIILAVPNTFPDVKGLWKVIWISVELGKTIVSIEGRLYSNNGKVSATALHTAVLKTTSVLDISV